MYLNNDWLCRLVISSPFVVHVSPFEINTRLYDRTIYCSWWTVDGKWTVDGTRRINDGWTIDGGRVISSMAGRWTVDGGRVSCRWLVNNRWSYIAIFFFCRKTHSVREFARYFQKTVLEISTLMTSLICARFSLKPHHVTSNVLMPLKSTVGLT